MSPLKSETPYLIYSRKFRPQGFDEVVGQEAIVRTLKNGIAQHRIPQNFLFSGPRGVGKTSMARIIAKALNCEKGPTGEPCDKCLACREIIQGNSLDVLEIDGASNRGIDEVRNLRETVKFKPVSGRTKIYIIDEVHMLTAEAFNALLKTLEEPPPHVKFIFATTEAHKVPLTILSRCQRFNFKRIPTAEIVRKLEEIVKKEKLKAEKNALFQIAKAADGALRDAEGLLDQLVSFAEDKITEAEVLAMLGLASEESFFRTLELLRAKDAKGLFALVRELYEGGVDLAQYAKGLFEFFRHLLLLQCSEAAGEFVDVSEEGVKRLKERRQDLSRSELLLAVNLLQNLQGQLRRNLAPPKMLIETALLKLMTLDQLKLVEKMIQETPAVSPSPVLRAAKPGESAPGTVLPRRNVPEAQAVRPDGTSSPAASSSAYPSGKPSPAKPAPPVDPAASAGGTAAAQASYSFNQVQAVWPQVIEYVKVKKMSNGIFLSEAAPLEVSGQVVTLGFPPEFAFHKEMLEKDANRRLVEEAFQVSLGGRTGIQFVVARTDDREPLRGDEAPLPAPGPGEGKIPDILQQAMNIFDGAKIVRKDP